MEKQNKETAKKNTATTKKSVKEKENKKQSIKEEIINDSVVKDDDMEELKKAFEKLQKENKEKDDKLNKFMEMLSTQSLGVSGNSKIVTSDDISYLVGTNMLTGLDLVSAKGDVIINVPYNDVVDATQHDLREVFKRKFNKQLFEDGVCYFVKDEENENEVDPNSLFRIKTKNDFTDEKIIEILEKDPTEMIDTFNQLTSFKNNNAITHMLFYKICAFDVDKKLNTLPRVTYDAIEKFFGISVSKGVINLGIYKTVPQP